MTDRLYYTDSYLTEFDANIENTADGGRRVFLDRTAFYPTSGGQLHDLGEINGVAVLSVEDDDARVAHVVACPLAAGPVQGRIDWLRRFDFMQQHTGQHLLSAVFEAELGARTVSVHFGEQAATVDLQIANVPPAELDRVELLANRIVTENRQVSIAFEDAASAQGLRKASEREGDLRIVSIDNLDRSACGGTHVRATGEIGPILLRRLDKVRGNVRVEFLCGGRAVAQVARDFQNLSKVSRQFSCSFDEAPAAVAALVERAKAQDKAARALTEKLAEFQAKELHAGAALNSNGIRALTQQLPSLIGDDARMLAQQFASRGRAALLFISNNPPSVLLACSADSGLHAGNLIKAAIALVNGKGGGGATIAQASLPDAAAVETVKVELSKHGL